MQNIKTQVSGSLLFSMLFFTLNLYSAAEAPKTPKEELDSAFPVLIPKELDSVFPVLTKAALYIAERVHINLVDCQTISLCCNAEELIPREAFIQTALSALYNGTSREIYPIIMVLLLELGHTAAAEADQTIDSQIKRCIEHISFMQSVIDILPLPPDKTSKSPDKTNILPNNTIVCYQCLSTFHDPEAPKKRRFVILPALNQDGNYGFLVRSTVGAFWENEHSKKTLEGTKKQLEDYLDDPEAFKKSLQVKKEAKPLEYTFF